MAGDDDYLAVDLCEIIFQHLEDSNMMNLAEAIYRTIHQQRGAIQGIATKTGINLSTLYRYALPKKQNGLDIPLGKLVPIMNAANYYEILKIVVASCGFVMVKLPRAARNKKDESEIVQAYQKACTGAVAKLLEFFDKPTPEHCEAASDALQIVTAESIAVKKRVERHHQHEINFQ